jgi:hypothetical protein
MKKIILGLSGLLALSLIVVLFINAQTSTQDVKKPATETSMNCGACPSASAAACAAKVENKTTEAKTCDPVKCKEMGCDPAKCKEGKCDPATCKANCTTAGGGMKNCDPAKCTGMAKK